MLALHAPAEKEPKPIDPQASYLIRLYTLQVDKGRVGPLNDTIITFSYGDFLIALFHQRGYDQKILALSERNLPKPQPI
jgi:hypothetical protein